MPSLTRCHICQNNRNFTVIRASFTARDCIQRARGDWRTALVELEMPTIPVTICCVCHHCGTVVSPPQAKISFPRRRRSS